MAKVSSSPRVGQPHQVPLDLSCCPLTPPPPSSSRTHHPTPLPIVPPTPLPIVTPSSSRTPPLPNPLKHPPSSLYAHPPPPSLLLCGQVEKLPTTLTTLQPSLLHPCQQSHSLGTPFRAATFLPATESDRMYVCWVYLEGEGGGEGDGTARETMLRLFIKRK